MYSHLKNAANSFALMNSCVGTGCVRFFDKCRRMYECTASNVRIVLTRLVHIRVLFAFRCKPSFRQVFLLKEGTHSKRGNTKPRLWEAASAQLVWTTYVYCAPSTNRNMPCLLPRFDVPPADESVCATYEAIASGWCVVHTTRAKAALYVLSSLKCVLDKFYCT